MFTTDFSAGLGTNLDLLQIRLFPFSSRSDLGRGINKAR